jgi:hypothetical protein
MPKATISLDATVLLTATTSVQSPVPAWTYLSGGYHSTLVLRPRAGVCYQAPRPFCNLNPRPRELVALGTPWGIFFRWSSTGHLSTQSWKPHQHRRDDSPCFMPIEHDPALVSRRWPSDTLGRELAYLHVYKHGRSRPLGGTSTIWPHLTTCLNPYRTSLRQTIRPPSPHPPRKTKCQRPKS